MSFEYNFIFVEKEALGIIKNNMDIQIKKIRVNQSLYKVQNIVNTAHILNKYCQLNMVKNLPRKIFHLTRFCLSNISKLFQFL